ncbi:MAG: CinA family nicotinamide mononucleotide deamidase-related protein [Bacteroidales bacterium]|nr:CinA family nicotinamide mononucleotide deamidase-related protein [Bacteroidales bacterium]
MKTAAICAIGDEILIGQIVDTNSSHISRALGSIGVRVKGISSIGDDRETIISHLDNLLKNNDIVIVTGGLGPTKDDITKEALATLSGAKGYYRSQEQTAVIESILSRRGIAMLDINRAQADVPDTARVIVNKLGTAPIMEFAFDAAKYGHRALLYSMPGVPYETLAALDDVTAAIKSHFEMDEILHRTICTFGMAESVLAKTIEAWESALPDYLHLAYLPNAIYGVRLRLSLYGAHEQGRKEAMEAAVNELYALLGNYIYGEGEDTLQTVIPRLLQAPPAAAYQETISAAESCTGGLVSNLITSVPGSSAYYKGSVTSYANEVKTNLLNVSEEILEKYGAVSRECAEAMARGVSILLDTDWSVATTGIAGPTGGSDAKPVGTCWTAAAHRNPFTGEVEVVSRLVKSASASREVNMQRFASNALNLLRLFMQQKLL